MFKTKILKVLELNEYVDLSLTLAG